MSEKLISVSTSKELRNEIKKTLKKHSISYAHFIESMILEKGHFTHASTKLQNEVRKSIKAINSSLSQFEKYLSGVSPTHINFKAATSLVQATKNQLEIFSKAKDKIVFRKATERDQIYKDFASLRSFDSKANQIKNDGKQYDHKIHVRVKNEAYVKLATEALNNSPISMNQLLLNYILNAQIYLDSAPFNELDRENLKGHYDRFNTAVHQLNEFKKQGGNITDDMVINIAKKELKSIFDYVKKQSN